MAPCLLKSEAGRAPLENTSQGASIAQRHRALSVRSSLAASDHFHSRLVRPTSVRPPTIEHPRAPQPRTADREAAMSPCTWKLLGHNSDFSVTGGKR